MYSFRLQSHCLHKDPGFLKSVPSCCSSLPPCGSLGLQGIFVFLYRPTKYFVCSSTHSDSDLTQEMPILLLLLLLLLLCILPQAFSSWYFSWTSGDPHRSGFKLHTVVFSVLCVMLQVLLLLLLLLLSLGGSSPYTSTKKANKNTLYVNETIHRNTVQTIQNTVHTSIYICQNTHTHTITQSHITIRFKTTTVHDTPKWISHNTIKYPQHRLTLLYTVPALSVSVSVISINTNSDSLKEDMSNEIAFKN